MPSCNNTVTATDTSLLETAGHRNVTVIWRNVSKVSSNCWNTTRKFFRLHSLYLRSIVSHDWTLTLCFNVLIYSCFARFESLATKFCSRSFISVIRWPPPPLTLWHRSIRAPPTTTTQVLHALGVKMCTQGAPWIFVSQELHCLRCCVQKEVAVRTHQQDSWVLSLMESWKVDVLQQTWWSFTTRCNISFQYHIIYCTDNKK